MSVGRQVLLAGLTCLLLAGCGGETSDDSAAARQTDPAVAAALSGQIMTDPDLSSENAASAAGALPSLSGGLPPEDDSPGAIVAAREEAARMLGGTSSMLEAPAGRDVAIGVSIGPILLAAARAGTDAQCEPKMTYTMQWAARMPEATPIYPRGNVQEASGVSDGVCDMRSITFTTPVPLADILNFYFTRTRKAGFTIDRIRQNGDEVLGGTRGGAAFLIYARRLASGRSEVDLMTRED